MMIAAVYDFKAVTAGDRGESAEAKFRAEWQGGQFLREIERGLPGRPEKNTVQPEPNFSPYQSALEESGLSESTAKRWQIMSMVPESDLAAYCARQRQKSAEITSADVYRLGRQWLKEQRPEEFPQRGSRGTLFPHQPGVIQVHTGLVSSLAITVRAVTGLA